MPVGNPFEASILVKCVRNKKVVHSFFIHELAPNSSICQLHARIVQQQNAVPFADWVLTRRTSTGKQRALQVLKLHLTFEDYDIKSWDCVYVVPRSERPARCFMPTAALACGSLVRKTVDRLGGALARRRLKQRRGSVTRASSLTSVCSFHANEAAEEAVMLTA
ncbi:hypothetical protein FBU31_000394 [Coemansia sp. 'formosensis']|nr:hypothetical protein FBU31_000394 [Coemansia sp. 'formosensis']